MENADTPTVTSAFPESLQTTYQTTYCETKYLSFAATDIPTIQTSNFQTYCQSIFLPNTATTSKAVEEAEFSTDRDSDTISTDQTFKAADSKTYTTASPTTIEATFISAH